MEDLNQTFKADPASVKLLLFIDKRPSSGEFAQKLRSHLKKLDDDKLFSLDVVDVSEQPYLVEHFKLIATPSLVKFSPGKQQVLSGSDILTQLDQWWPHWKRESKSASSIHDNGYSLESSNGLTAPGQDDITHSVEVMKLSDEIFRLKQEKEDLEAQLRFKNRIVAMLAHDLRNPLTAASIAVETLELGYGEASKRPTSLSPKLTSQLLVHAKNQIRAMDRMISDILQTAKGASADLQIQPQDVSFNNLFAEALASMRNKLEARSQQVDIDIPQDLPHIYVDPGQIQRVLFNLIDNAIKYTPKGGELHISALHRTTQKIQICVRDSGPGIPKEKCDEIFEDRFRLQRDREKDGYGIGLALCRRIIRAHYGQIWVESTPGEGSEFLFTLPVFRS